MKRIALICLIVLISTYSNGSNRKGNGVFNAVVATDGSGDYGSIQAAIDAVPDGRTQPWLIFVKNGTYEELVIVPETKPFVHLIGQDKAKTIIKYHINNGGKNSEGWEYSTNNPNSKTYGYDGVFEIKASDFFAENITFENAYGTESHAGPQAQALRTKNDRQAFYNCNMRSFQDTWFTTVTESQRLYVKNCRIEGAVDYIYGAGDCLFEDCLLYNVRSGSVIVAPSHTNDKYGYAFRNCVVDGNAEASNGKQLLGRPWHNNSRAVFINTVMQIPIKSQGWTDMGAIPSLFAEYNSRDRNGNLLDLSSRKQTYTFTRNGITKSGTCRTTISEKEAEEYSYKNMILCSDGWNPQKFYQHVAAPKNIVQKKNKLTWTASPNAIGYIVIDDHENVVAITPKPHFKKPKRAQHYTVKAVNKYGDIE